MIIVQWILDNQVLHVQYTELEKYVSPELTYYAAVRLAFGVENWHTGYFYAGQRSRQFCELCLLVFEPEAHRGRTDGRRTGKTRTVAY